MKVIKMVSVFAMVVFVLAALGTLTPCSPQGETTLKAHIEMRPEILNLKSKDRLITCFVKMPVGCKVSDIISDRVVLSHVGGYKINIKPVECNIINNGDVDSELMLKYRRSELISAIIDNNLMGQIEVSVTGRLHDNTPFMGSDIIKVLNLSTFKEQQLKKYLILLPLLCLPAY